MERLDEFRLYYVQSIAPELLRMERQRLRVLVLLFVSVLVLGGLVAFQFYINIWVITLVLLIPHVFFIGYLVRQFQRFRNRFKPNVVDLLLDFIDNGPNFDTNYPLSYRAKEGITKKMFLSSGLFVTPAPYYVAEDKIWGKIGEIEFELCELDARENSPVRADLDEVFKGIFLHAYFKAQVGGQMRVWPRERRQYLTKSIKEFTFIGARNVDHEIMNDNFRRLFMVYATSNTHVAGLLPETMQEAIVRYQTRLKRNLYFSFNQQDFFIGISQPKDLLEPYIFRSNLSFDLILEFMNDITLILDIVKEFDQKI
ncbi:MAG: DUF3137 domain-containing protein [Saprospiraceae bacterium]